MLFLPSHMDVVIIAEACHAFPAKAAAAVPQPHFPRISKHRRVGQCSLPFTSQFQVLAHQKAAPGWNSWAQNKCALGDKGKVALGLLVPSFVPFSLLGC